MEAFRKAEQRLARALIALQPAAAAAVLEGIPPESAAQILCEASPEEGAAVLGRMVPGPGAAVIEHMPADRAHERLRVLPQDALVSLLRRLDVGARQRTLSLLDPETIGAVRPLLEHPDGTAGAVMDTRVLTLADDLEVRAARSQVMEHPSETHYNLYIVARDGTLVGVLNLRELFASPDRELLRTVMRPATFQVSSRADRLEVIAHPGWKHVHSLPVVDETGRFLGAIRFHALRALEEEVFRKAATRMPSTGRALGELYWTGVSGVLEAFVTALGPRPDRSPETDAHERGA